MTYSDNYNLRDKDVAKMNDVADAIDNVVKYSNTEDIVTTWSTSTSYTAIDNMALTVTVPADKLVVVRGIVPFSMNSTAYAVYFGISEDSTTTPSGNPMPLWPEEIGTLTSGKRNLAVFECTFQPSAGSHTYRLLWKVDSGATVYNAGVRRISATIL